MDAFVDLLLSWNQRINLVSGRDRSEILTRHIEDSLQLLPLLPADGAPVADLGTGGGFPGLVLAIADANRPFHLIESDRRKAGFLATAVGALGLSRVVVHPARIEAVALPPLPCVTARAVAPLVTLLGHAHRLLAPGGTAVFPKGRGADAELTEAARSWTFGLAKFASRTDPDATIFRFHDIRPAGG